jgi:hypothetical protein
MIEKQASMRLLHKLHEAWAQAAIIRIFECNTSETTEEILIKFGIRGLHWTLEGEFNLDFHLSNITSTLEEAQVEYYCDFGISLEHYASIFRA